jgi:hypothetical protein
VTSGVHLPCSRSGHQQITNKPPGGAYSMILSALTSTVGGILRPSAFAVF